MKRVFVSFSVLFLMLVATPSALAVYDDIDVNHEYYKEFKDLKNRNILANNKMAYPDKSLSRAEIAKIAIIAGGYEIETAPKIPFPDLTADWQHDILYTAKKLGIVQGYENGNFGPDDPVTKSQAAKIIMEALETRFETPTSDIYDDVKSNDNTHWWSKYVYHIFTKNLDEKNSDNEFGVDKPVTRKQAFRWMYRKIKTNESFADRFSDDLEEEESQFEDIEDFDDMIDIDDDFNLDDLNL